MAQGNKLGAGNKDYSVFKVEKNVDIPAGYGATSKWDGQLMVMNVGDSVFFEGEENAAEDSKSFRQALHSRGLKERPATSGLRRKVDNGWRVWKVLSRDEALKNALLNKKEKCE